jgi:hypothetical protein
LSIKSDKKANQFNNIRKKSIIQKVEDVFRNCFSENYRYDMEENSAGIIKLTEIESRIITIRGVQVMLDSHLAELYCVETKYLNRAVKRNSDRFPNEFMFQLTDNEWEILRLQIGTSKIDNSLRSQNVTLKNNSQNLK